MEKKSNDHAGHRQRMREKLLNYPYSLAEHELLEIILYSALPRANTNGLAHKLIKIFGSFEQVLKADKELLLAVDGVGEAACSAIKAVNRAAEIRMESRNKGVEFKYCEYKKELVKYFQDKQNECMLLYLLDKNNRIKGFFELDGVLLDEIMINVQEIAKYIAVSKPRSAIISHNHPSGNETPSASDDMTTKKVAALLGLHGVKLLDHIIVAGQKVYSYFHCGRTELLKFDSSIL